MMLLSRSGKMSFIHKWVAKLKIIPIRRKVARAKNKIPEKRCKTP
jgi:hypothetical protein